MQVEMNIPSKLGHDHVMNARMKLCVWEELRYIQMKTIGGKTESLKNFTPDV